LSPFLFNPVPDMLNILIARAKEDVHVDALIPHLLDRVSILQHVDDTIIFMEHNIEKGLTMELILRIFEQYSGLKINFCKSEVFYFGRAKKVED
jgi:hypothetical protein